MSRPYQPQPPFNRSAPGAPGAPMNPGPPTSFKTNVNRAKTKRWVEAKSYSYDGDDWGEVDDYDEYAGYDDSTPPPNPTGFRQQGQSPSPVVSSGHGTASSAYDRFDMRRDPSWSTGQQGLLQEQQYSNKGPTVPAQLYESPSRERSNSFNNGDEARSFSAGGTQQPGLSTPLSNPVPILGTPQMRRPSAGQQFYQQPNQSKSRRSIDGQHPLGSSPQPSVPPANYRGVSYSDRQRVPGDGSRAQSMTSNTPSFEFQNRRDFSPSAMPLPLHTAPRGHPPRNSSLGQEDATSAPIPMHPTTKSAQAASLSTSQQEGISTVQSPPDTATKPLPFVRPADIYKRMQEEREKERKSQESSRPSIDAIAEARPPLPWGGESMLVNFVSGKAAEKTLGTPGSQPELTSGSDDGNGYARAPVPTAAPERNADHGKVGYMPGPKSTDSVGPLNGGRESAGSGHLQHNSNSLGGRPLLPEVARISGFGESFLESLETRTSDVSQRPAEDSSQRPPELPISQPPLRQGHDTPLRDQPSLGFRSVVNKAFEDQVPPTPSSTSGSGVARSNSESTNDISPIISRAPSAVNPEAKVGDSETRDMSISSIAEEPPISTPRPNSQENAPTPKAISRKLSSSQDTRPASSGSGPPSFIPGHRRDISTPSPDNSPARTPVLEVNRQPRQPQEVELGMTTPTSMTHSNSSSSNQFPKSQEHEPESADLTPTKKTLPDSPSKSFADSPVSTNTSRVLPGAESPSKSRVRDLAEKFESPTVSRPNSRSSFKDIVSSTRSPTMENATFSKPSASRNESFRPQLPGGWESYASAVPAEGGCLDADRAIVPNAQVPTHGDRSMPENSFLSGSDYQANLAQRNTLQSRSQNDAVDDTPTTVERSMSSTTGKEPSSDPFSVVAAAGSALAGAIVSAVGIQYNGGNESEDTKVVDKQSEDVEGARRRSASMQNTDYHPEASKPWIPSADDGDSSIMPTPIAMTSMKQIDARDSSEYFPPVVPLKQKAPISEVESDQIPYRPHILPTLSTDTSPHDYESDRLRKEIVRELSPHNERLANDQTSELQTSVTNDSRQSVSSGKGRQNHDSMVLPREYDSYWNGSNSGDDLSRPISHQGVSAPMSSIMPLSHDQMRSMTVPPQDTGVAQNISQLHGLAQSPEQSVHLQVRPDVLKHRFSWEAEPETEEIESSSKGSHSNIELYQAVSTTSHGMDTPRPLEQQSGIVPDLARTPRMSKELPDRPEGEMSSKAEESSSQYYPGLNSEKPDDTSTKPTLPIAFPPLPATQPNLPTFREILALRSPGERIDAYNRTREQFANMNTGLEHWIVATINDLPEHAELLKNGSNYEVDSSHRMSPSLSKFGGLRSASGQAAQQPYYQQYLNASSKPAQSHPMSVDSQTQGSPAGGSPSTGSGGKISGQQMQARGKDLLHSAGVLGGKANIAAKGLFSKGRSKLRGSGGNDKVVPRDSPVSNFNPAGMQAQIATTQSPSDLNGIMRPRSVDGQIRSRVHSGRPISSIFPVSPQDDDAFSTRFSTSGPDHNSSHERHPGEHDLPISIVSTSLVPRSSTSANDSRERSPAQPNPMIIGDSAPTFLKDTRTASSQAQSPGPLPTPKSCGSSNRTPTQADFPILDVEIPGSPSIPLHHVTSLQSREPTTLNTSIEPGTSRTALATITLEKPLISRQTVNPWRFANDGRIQETGQVTPLAQDDHIVDIDRGNFRSSEDSAETYHTANGGENGPDREVPLDNSINHSKIESSVFDSRTPEQGAPYRNSKDGMQSSFAERAHHPSTDTQPRPFSFIQFGQLPEDLSLHSRGNGSLSEDRTLTVNAPVHHDTTYDFTPAHSQSSSSRSRPRSFSRPFQDPNVHQHPAFRQDRTSNEMSDMPTQYHDPEIRRNEARLPRQQETEYQLPGVGPPSAEQLSNKSRSRQGSRSSAFFNNFTSSPKTDVSVKSKTDGYGKSGTPAISPIHVEKRNKRASIFRSFTSNTKSDSSRSRENSFSQPHRSHTEPQTFGYIKRPAERLLKGLSQHKITPSVDAELRSFSATVQGTGQKKRRFSSFGGIFGRSGQTQPQSPTVALQSASVKSPPQVHSSFRGESTAPQIDYDDGELPPAFPTAYQYHKHTSSRPLPQPEYAPPPLEGYYSPDRRSGTFSSSFINGQRSPSGMSPLGVPPYARPKSYVQEVKRLSQSQPLNHNGLSGIPSSPHSPQGGVTIRHVSNNDPQVTSTFSATSPRRTEMAWSSSTNPKQHDLFEPTIPREDSPPPPPPPKDERYLPSPKQEVPPGTRISLQNQRSPTSFPLPQQQVQKHSHQNLPPLQTSIPSAQRSPREAYPMTPEEVRKVRQQEIESTGHSIPGLVGQGAGPGVAQEEEEIVMSGSSYPGQEWHPGYGNWDGD